MFVFFSRILVALLEKIGPRVVTGQAFLMDSRAELNRMAVRHGFFELLWFTLPELANTPISRAS
jgi:hypothetical protein